MNNVDAQLREFNALPKPEAETIALDPPVKRRGFDLPEGAVGIFFLLIIAAVSGGLIAVYWPWQQASNEPAAVAENCTSAVVGAADPVQVRVALTVNPESAP